VTRVSHAPRIGNVVALPDAKINRRAVEARHLSADRTAEP
jgi:hypothetical protein